MNDEKFEKLNKFGFNFENLFLSYGERKSLKNIYLQAFNLTQTPNFLKEKQFAPFETEFGWAEPFIAKLILSYFNMFWRFYF